MQKQADPPSSQKDWQLSDISVSLNTNWNLTRQHKARHLHSKMWTCAAVFLYFLRAKCSFLTNEFLREIKSTLFKLILILELQMKMYCQMCTEKIWCWFFSTPLVHAEDSVALSIKKANIAYSNSSSETISGKIKVEYQKLSLSCLSPFVCWVLKSKGVLRLFVYIPHGSHLPSPFKVKCSLIA